MRLPLGAATASVRSARSSSSRAEQRPKVAFSGRIFCRHFYCFFLALELIECVAAKRKRERVLLSHKRRRAQRWRISTRDQPSCCCHPWRPLYYTSAKRGLSQAYISKRHHAEPQRRQQLRTTCRRPTTTAHPDHHHRRWRQCLDSRRANCFFIRSPSPAPLTPRASTSDFPTPGPPPQQMAEPLQRAMHR